MLVVVGCFYSWCANKRMYVLLIPGHVLSRGLACMLVVSIACLQSEMNTSES